MLRHDGAFFLHHQSDRLTGKPPVGQGDLRLHCVAAQYRAGQAHFGHFHVSFEALRSHADGVQRYP